MNADTMNGTKYWTFVDKKLTGVTYIKGVIIEQTQTHTHTHTHTHHVHDDINPM